MLEALRTLEELVKQKQLLYYVKDHYLYFMVSKKRLAGVNSFINFIINIKRTNTNIFINVTDVRGNSIVSYRSGMTVLKEKHRTKESEALKLLLGSVIKKVEFLKKFPVGLHLTNFNKRNKKFVLKYLSKELFISTFRNYHLRAFNGCRIKKLRRKNA